MHSKKIRMLAVLLVLCLLFQNGGNMGTWMRTQAEEGSSVENSIKEEAQSGDKNAEADGEEESKDDNAGSKNSADGDGSAENSGSSNDSSNNGNDSDNKSGTETGNKSDESKGNENGAESGSGENNNNNSDAENGGVDKENDNSDAENGDEANDSDAGEEEDGAETDADAEAEETEAEENGIALFADGEEERQSIPDSADDYKTGVIYVFSTAADYLKIQEHSKETDFKGIVFRVGSNEGNDTVEIGDDFPGADFEGFGTEEYPFRGSLSSDYNSGSLSFALTRPLFAYLGSGAEIYNLDLICEKGTEAAIAKVVVFEKDETEPLKLHDIKISGVIDKSGENAGTIAGTFSDDVSISLEKVSSEVTGIKGKNAGGIAGAVGSDVSIKTKETTFSGKVTGSETAGGCYGSITGSHTFTEAEYALLGGREVAAGDNCYAGALAGSLRVDTAGEDSVVLKADNEAIEIKANVTGSGISGGLFGVCEADAKVGCEKALTILGKVSGKEAGGIVGRVADDFLLKGDAFTCAAQITGSEAAGGFFGTVSADAFAPKAKEDDAAPALTLSGSVKSDVDAGGYAGSISSSLIIPKLTMTGEGKVSSKKNAGGVVGRLNGAKCILMGASLASGSSISGETASGGILGAAQKSALELQDTAELSCKLEKGNKGIIAGTQEKSLLYFSDTVAAGEHTKQLVAGSETEGWEEVGGFGGGVFRNQEAGDGLLIGNGKLAEVGSVKTGYVTGADPAYTLKGTNGMVCLAIALWSQGFYGMPPFGYTDGDEAAVADLLKAAYTLDGDADISYDTAGIVTVNRNNTTDAADAFSGKLIGAKEDTCITQNSRTFQTAGRTPNENQPKVGIFSTIAGDTVFEKLTIDGTIQYANGAGGIAYRSVGNSLTLKQVKTQKEFKNLRAVSVEASSIGGILAREESTASPFSLKAEDVLLGSKIDAGGNVQFSGFITGADLIDMELSNIKLGGSLKSTVSNGSEIGGFLGRNWDRVSGELDGLSVEPGTTFYAAGKFGGLFNFLRNRQDTYISLKNIKLDGLTVDVKEEGRQWQCALLIRVGRMLAVNIEDYSAEGCIIKNAGAKFDEISGTVNNNSNYTSGLISLHKTGKTFPDYYYKEEAIYENCQGRTDGKGGKTTDDSDARYFYDVFQILEEQKQAGGTGDILDTPGKLLLWSVYHNLNGEWLDAGYGNRSTDNKTLFAAYVPTGNAVTIKGELDLKNVSFYPVPNANGMKITGENAKLIFHADAMNGTAGDAAGGNDAAWTLPVSLYSNNNGSQHYGMHSGLFVNANNLTVSGLSLSGTVAYRGSLGSVAGGSAQDGSGTLVAGVLSGGGKFENITADNLWVDGYTGQDKVGLLIAGITAAETKQENTVDVTFGTAGVVSGAGTAGVIMTGYPAGSAKYAAGALIGTAGSDKMTNLRLDFRNMKVADEKDETHKHNGRVLKYASFLCSYHHTPDADAYTGRCWYLFTEEEAKKTLTYGEELDDLTEYWWENTETPDPHKLVVSDLQAKNADFSPANYLPYVHEIEQIEVNPKPGDILKGCGTYEDPYQIETVKQFLTLYRYLNMMRENSESADERAFFQNWKVIPMGTDASVCAGSHAEADAKRFGEDGFPSQAALRRAYYQLAGDIDLSQIKSGNYKTITDNFVGFGTKEYPFVGVWYGKDPTGKIHTVTLPKKSSLRTHTAFGFLQYAKGAVIKDIKIASPVPDTGEEQKDVITRIEGYHGMAGGVIGCVLGGDNIIDNVTTDVQYMALMAKNNAHTFSAIGGYVGCVKKGGVILRNTELTDVSEFYVLSQEGTAFTENPNAEAASTKAGGVRGYYLGAVAGRVEDGYILHEGSGSASTLWEADGLGGKDGAYETVPFYAVVNGDYLEKNAKATVTAPGADGFGTITLDNAAALQAASMALNADALNTRNETDSEQGNTPKTYGYTGYSRSRKAKYSALGCKAAADTNADYELAVSYDNEDVAAGKKNQTYPYLWKYLGITKEDAASFMKAGVSLFNPAQKVDGTAYRTNWVLGGAQTYDLSEFGRGFRGLGALYDPEDGAGGTFRGNFNGNGNTVKLDRYSIALKECYDDAQLTPSFLRTAGLFNTILAVGATRDVYGEDGILIQKLTVTGSVKLGEPDAGYVAFDAGGVIGRIEMAQVTLENVTAKDMVINAGIKTTQYKSGNSEFGYFGNAGGLIGAVRTANDDKVENAQLVLRDCRAENTAKPQAAAITSVGHVGGLIGFAGLKKTILIENTKVTAAERLYLQSISENAGGLIGYASHTNWGAKLSVQGKETLPIVKDCTVDAFWNGGGVCGESGMYTDMKDIRVEDATVLSYKTAGGVLGTASSWGNLELTGITVLDSTVKEKSTTNPQPYDSTTGQGGIVGRHGSSGKMTLKKAYVGGSMSIASAENKRLRSNVERANGVGGLVGASDRGELILADCLVKDAKITAGIKMDEIIDLSSACAGGLVGYSYVTSGDKALRLSGDYLHTENLTITAPVPATNDKGNFFAAGGLFGYIQNDLLLEGGDGYYSGISAKGNTLTGKQAGGLIGATEGKVALSGKKTSASVTLPDGSSLSAPGGGGVLTSKVDGSLAAGGLIGACSSGSFVALNKEADDDAAAQAADKMILQEVSVSGKYAGGAIGSVSMGGNLRLESMELDTCKVTGTSLQETEKGGSAVGGLLGILELRREGAYVKLYHNTLKNSDILYLAKADTLNAAEGAQEGDTDNHHIAVGGILGMTSAATANKAGNLYADDICLAETNKIGVQKEGSEDVFLIDKDGKLQDITMPASAKCRLDGAAQLSDAYGYYVGMLLGAVRNDAVKLYLMRIHGSGDKDVMPTLTQKNTPVTDVGRIPGEDADAYRKVAHVLYGTLSSAEKDGADNIERMDKAVNDGIAAYDSSALRTLLETYRLPEEITAQEAEGATPAVTKKLEEFWQETYALTGSIKGGTEEKLPVLCVKPGVMSLDAQIKLLSDIMTNVAGLSASKLEILNITQNKVTWDLSTDTRTSKEATEENACIRITGNSKTGYNFAYNEQNFDAYDKTANKLSYTELVYTYRLADKHVRTYILPLYVEEPLVLDITAKLLAGRVASEEEMADGIDTTATLANDSDYTLLLDFSYGDARKSYATAMEKQIYLTNTQGVKRFENGTRLLLIDITNGNKPYYYTVTDSSPEKLPLSAFTDTGLPAGSEGTTAYTELSIGRDKNADGTTAYDGHDRYLLQVLPGAKGENAIYDIHVGFRDVNDDNKASLGMIGTTERTLHIDAIPGLKFKLLESGDKNPTPKRGTRVTGTLQENAALTVDMEFAITMDPSYKDKTNPMDSANNGKYLDLGIYLTDLSGKRVPLPNGTNIRYTDANGVLVTQTITDYTASYYYKDIAKVTFPIRGEGGITDSVQKDMQVELILPGDLTALTENAYKVHIDLLRSDDAAHPAGYEDALDTYETTIGAQVITKLGFAVTVAQEDWEKLGVNLYQYEEEFGDGDTHEIPFKMQVDFSNILKSVSGDKIISEWADRDYYITCQIFAKKNDGSAAYGSSPFTDSEETMKLAALQDDTEQETWQEGQAGTLQMKYHFTEAEIRKNQDSLLKKGEPISRSGKVVLDMEHLKKISTKEELETYLTNYMMQATLQVTQKDVPPSAISQEDPCDFFIYEVTKLKSRE